VIGHSHSELGRMLQSDPICAAETNYSAFDSDETRSVETRPDEFG